MVEFDAAILPAVGQPLEIRRTRIDRLERGDVLVRIMATGLCHTDLEVIDGSLAYPMPIVLGHEGAGVVEAVGEDVTDVKASDHVVCSWNPHCGHCFYCERDQPILCEPFTFHQPRGHLLDGKSRLTCDAATVHHFSVVSSHAQYAVVPQSGAIAVPKEIPFDRACLIGCGVMTGVGAAVRLAPVEVPGPDPFEPDEQRRILAWFRAKRFGFHVGRATEGPRLRPHPHFHAFVHVLLWTGMRPSEAAGLRWGNVDLQRGALDIVRSRHLYEDSAPKTERARRTVELLPETVRVLSAIQPLRLTPETPVFVNTGGRPLEPRAFHPHWYACLRALGIRSRGIYSCKDTYVSTVLPLKPIPWIEEQTGVAYATLKKHYGRWKRREQQDEASIQLERLAEGIDLCPLDTISELLEAAKGAGTSGKMDLFEECRGGESNPYTLAGCGF